MLDSLRRADCHSWGGLPRVLRVWVKMNPPDRRFESRATHLSPGQAKSLGYQAFLTSFWGYQLFWGYWGYLFLGCAVSGLGGVLFQVSFGQAVSLTLFGRSRDSTRRLGDSELWVPMCGWLDCHFKREKSEPVLGVLVSGPEKIGSEKCFLLFALLYCRVWVGGFEAVCLPRIECLMSEVLCSWDYRSEIEFIDLCLWSPPFV